MVGASCRANRENPVAHAILIVGSKVTDLNSVLPANSRWVLHMATDVNGLGAIVGIGTYGQKPHGFMLVPRV
jgi:hypothetical protein